MYLHRLEFKQIHTYIHTYIYNFFIMGRITKVKCRSMHTHTHTHTHTHQGKFRYKTPGNKNSISFSYLKSNVCSVVITSYATYELIKKNPSTLLLFTILSLFLYIFKYKCHSINNGKFFKKNKMIFFLEFFPLM